MKLVMEKLFEATARIEQVIWIAGALAAGDDMAEELREFFEYEDNETIERCFGPIPDYVDLEAHGFDEAISEWIQAIGEFGFLVKFATPVMKPSGRGCRLFSWGYYSTKWVYAKTLDEAVEQGLAFVSARRASEDAEFAEAEGGVF